MKTSLDLVKAVESVDNLATAKRETLHMVGNVIRKKKLWNLKENVGKASNKVTSKTKMNPRR